MSKEIYFFDTYALFEIIRGNPKYERYRDAIPILTILNIIELNLGLNKEFGKNVADSYMKKYWPYKTEILSRDIEHAVDIKIKNKDLSIPDVVGFAVAKRLGIKFLTGDEGFRHMNNVEFVKK